MEEGSARRTQAGAGELVHHGPRGQDPRSLRWRGGGAYSHRGGCPWRHTPPGARVQREVRRDPAMMAPTPQTPPDPAFVSPEYAENIGDGRSPEFRESEQKRILALLENF